jgi:uncharacterized protein YbjT (DUF2867 family)
VHPALEGDHQVLAIARSDAAAAALAKAGVEVRRASLVDVDVLREGAHPGLLANIHAGYYRGE